MRSPITGRHMKIKKANEKFILNKTHRTMKIVTPSPTSPPVKGGEMSAVSRQRMEVHFALAVENGSTVPSPLAGEG